MGTILKIQLINLRNRATTNNLTHIYMTHNKQPHTHIHDRSLSWFGTGMSINFRGVKLLTKYH